MTKETTKKTSEAEKSQIKLILKLPLLKGKAVWLKRTGKLINLIRSSFNFHLRLDKHRDSDQDVEKNSTGARGKGQQPPEKPKDGLPILKYLTNQVRNVFHAPFSLLVKGAVVLSEDLFIDIIPVAWELLLEADQEVAASSASLFIICAVRAPSHASDVMLHALTNKDVNTRINAILRFFFSRT